MIEKTELLTTASSLDELRRVIAAGADAVTVGEQKFGMRMPGEFSLAEIAEAVRFANRNGARIYVSVNNIMGNQVLAELSAYVKSLQECGVDAIVFGDPAVLMTAKQAAPGLLLHWSAEMTSTNYATANYWAAKGAVRMIAARELNMEQVLEIKRHVKMEVQVQVHGITNIYHSKRNLVKSYIKHQGNALGDQPLDANRGMYLVEMERQDEKYPVYEDLNGTHIMSSDDICMIENIHELLEAGIDSLKIEGLLKTAEYNETAVRCYRHAMDAYRADPESYQFKQEWLEPIQRLQPEGRELSFGFFYKEQVY